MKKVINLRRRQLFSFENPLQNFFFILAKKKGFVFEKNREIQFLFNRIIMNLRKSKESKIFKTIFNFNKRGKKSRNFINDFCFILKFKKHKIHSRIFSFEIFKFIFYQHKLHFIHRIKMFSHKVSFFLFFTFNFWDLFYHLFFKPNLFSASKIDRGNGL